MPAAPSLAVLPAAVGEPDERVWVAAIRAGDERAFERLFAIYYARLCDFTLGYVRSAEIAEELVQDLLLHLWRRRATLEVRGTLRGYLYAAARNRALDHLKRRRLEAAWSEEATALALGAPSLAPSADERALEGELAAAIRRAVDELPARTREAFLLRRQHHLSYAEIAGVMGIAPKTVEVHLGAALRSLRRRLAGWQTPREQRDER